MAKKSTPTRAAKSKAVLVATQEIHGGTEKGGRHTLAVDGELTDEIRGALGLDDVGIDELLASGALIERQARLAEDGENNAALQAATDRADKAEQDLAAAQTAIAELTARCERAEAAATKAKPAE